MTPAQKGLLFAALSPLLLGISPILGKMALRDGTDPFTVAALRMVLVLGLMWLWYALFWRRYIFIYNAGLIACCAVGFTNGVGSLFYYSGLARLDASVAQMLNATYLVFVVLLTRIEGGKIPPLVVLRVGVALLGVSLVAGSVSGASSWLGVGLMLANALLFGGTMVMSQRVLYEMPAQTVTLYVMSSMAVVVVLARIFSLQPFTPPSPSASLSLLALALTTALSRLVLFAGVKEMGGLRIALAAIAESAVALSLAFVLFEERFSAWQWVGALALVTSLFIPAELGADSRSTLPNAAGWRFQRMAGMEQPKLSSQEMRALTTTLVTKPTASLSSKELEVLTRLLGEDGVQKLRELESRRPPSV